MNKIIEILRNLIQPVTYESALEAYITANHPQDICQLEVLQKDFERSMTRK